MDLVQLLGAADKKLARKKDEHGRLPKSPGNVLDRLAALRKRCPRTFNPLGTTPHKQQPAEQLLFQCVFGVRVQHQTPGASPTYLQHPQCAIFLARALTVNEDALAAKRLRYYASSAEEITMPGSCVYLFDCLAPLIIASTQVGRTVLDPK
jgi:hypothetical protein